MKEEQRMEVMERLSSARSQDELVLVTDTDPLV